MWHIITICFGFIIINVAHFGSLCVYRTASSPWSLFEGSSNSLSGWCLFKSHASLLQFPHCESSRTLINTREFKALRHKLATCCNKSDIPLKFSYSFWIIGVFGEVMLFSQTVATASKWTLIARAVEKSSTQQRKWTVWIRYILSLFLKTY